MLTVLVVDDEPQTVKDISRLLERKGWIADGATNGKEALELLSAQYDAVVLDLKMPILGGEGTLKAIRRRPELDATCVVILTAYGEIKGAVRALRLGAYQYIEKPCQAKDLHRILVGGVALQRAHSLRRKLLATRDLGDLFRQIQAIILDTFQPRGLNILFLNSDGSVGRKLEGSAEAGSEALPDFVSRLVDARHAVFAEGPEVQKWNPRLADTKVFIAAPVFDSDSAVVGIIYLESDVEDGFDRSWLDVVSYLADIAGIALEVAKKTEETIAALKERAEAMAAKADEETKKRDQLVQLAQGARHQFATPAQVIQLHAGELLAKEVRFLPDEPRNRAERRLTVIQQNTELIQAACNYLDDIARDVEIRKLPLDLVKLVETCGEEIEPDLRERSITFRFDRDTAGPLIVKADSNQLRYSLQCILRNAIEAIDERRDQILDPDFDPAKADDRIVVKLDPVNSNWVTLRIQDTGNGINADDRNRLFTPLFTTKTRPQTGGLGLFTVKRIIDSHGGRVAVDSKHGEGTVFSLSLPLE